jgi:tetratricopeptide (TPR) repeat protein
VAPVRAPDISSMSPAERADRLYDRVMRLHSEGKDDSVRFFSPMVLTAYQMIGPLDADQHYDLGRIGEVLGNTDLARAEADTILRDQPTHLLGLTLAARAATLDKQPDKARDFYKRLLAAEPAERKRALPEYDRHRDDIDAAIATARGTLRASKSA